MADHTHSNRTAEAVVVAGDVAVWDAGRRGADGLRRPGAEPRFRLPHQQALLGPQHVQPSVPSAARCHLPSTAGVGSVEEGRHLACVAGTRGHAKSSKVRVRQTPSFAD